MARISRHIGTNNWHGKTWPIWEMNMAVYRSVNLSSFFFPKIYFPIFLVFMLYVTYSKWTACLQVQIQLKLKLLLKPVLRRGNYLISAQVPVLFHVLGSIPAPTPAAPAKKKTFIFKYLFVDIWYLADLFAGGELLKPSWVSTSVSWLSTFSEQSSSPGTWPQ